ncbi:unnamed protein product [Ectocarpus sp. CCAP 1310/34]|nr:unnamed protein product [Ectocarpus sp. CCAP 1310/34]
MLPRTVGVIALDYAPLIPSHETTRVALKKQHTDERATREHQPQSWLPHSPAPSTPCLPPFPCF